MGNEKLKSRILRLINCRLAKGEERWSVTIDQSRGIIQSIDAYDAGSQPSITFSSDTHDYEEMDCGGCLLSPGYIDIQLNGAFGVDFSDPNLSNDDVMNVSKLLPQFGVTSFCPTMVTSSLQTYRRNISLIGKMCVKDRERYHRRRDDCGMIDEATLSDNTDVTDRANLIGMHLEGPFFAKEKKGAHSEAYIRSNCVPSSPSHHSTLMEETYGVPDVMNSGVSIITLAPELEMALDLITYLSKSGVVVAMGHTSATLQQAMDGINHGATLITHLFNAMNPFHHREPGMLGVITAHSSCNIDQPSLKDSTSNNGTNPAMTKPTRPYFSIIADGLHSHTLSVKMAHSINPKRVVLITDAMPAMGLQDGDHFLGSLGVTVVGKRATIKGTNTLAGSVVSMDSCVKSYREFCECSVAEALDAATVHPAEVLGLEGKGKIQLGCDADLVLLDDDLGVMKTWVNGTLVYERDRDETCVSKKKRKIAENCDL